MMQCRDMKSKRAKAVSMNACANSHRKMHTASHTTFHTNFHTDLRAAAKPPPRIRETIDERLTAHARCSTLASCTPSTCSRMITLDPFPQANGREPLSRAR